ncbi:MAG: hypothetical protein RLZZ06_818 [Actinomycetota bacterium]|jgi:methionine-rich copper-binding protein CopC
MNALKKTLAALSLILLSFVGVPAASAHTEIDHTTPGAGTSVEAGTQSVSVVFTDKILDLADSSEIVISGPDGSEVPTSCLEVKNTSLNIEAFLGNEGDYKVTWRTVAEDGHAITGDFGFSVTGTADNADFVSCKDAASQSGTPVVIATPKAYSVETKEETTTSESALYWIGGVAVLAVAGIMFFVVRRKRSKAKA